MSKQFTDRELELVTQLAYCNFDLEQYKLDSKKGELPTIQEYLKWYVDANADAKHGLYSIFYNYDNEANHAPDASEDTIWMRTATENFLDALYNGTEYEGFIFV